MNKKLRIGALYTGKNEWFTELINIHIMQPGINIKSGDLILLRILYYTILCQV